MKKVKTYYLIEQVCDLIDDWSKKTGITKSQIVENGIQKEVAELKTRYPEFKQ